MACEMNDLQYVTLDFGVDHNGSHRVLAFDDLFFCHNSLKVVDGVIPLQAF